jgi:hypothetical protein
MTVALSSILKMDDDLGDITVHGSGAHGGDSNLLADKRPDEHVSFEEPRFVQPNGSENRVVTPVIQTVLTKQGIMELVAKDVDGIVPGSEWEQRKQGYCNMLKGYESPTGNTSRVSLMAQREQNEKLVKQAEEHRELVQKEFTESMLRMKTEHDKTILEAARIRD